MSYSTFCSEPRLLNLGSKLWENGKEFFFLKKKDLSDLGQTFDM